jgi:hypothetical protein
MILWFILEHFGFEGHGVGTHRTICTGERAGRRLLDNYVQYSGWHMVYQDFLRLTNESDSLEWVLQRTVQQPLGWVFEITKGMIWAVPSRGR